MRYTLLFSISILMMASCKKNKYNTVPSLKFKSVNTTLLKPGQTLVFTLKFTDLEGDLTDTVWVIKKEPKCIASNFTAPYHLPAFPTSKNQEGELVISFSYPNVNPQCSGKNDTAVFKFVLRDKALHKSDTAVSSTIIISR